MSLWLDLCWDNYLVMVSDQQMVQLSVVRMGILKDLNLVNLMGYMLERLKGH